LFDAEEGVAGVHRDHDLREGQYKAGELANLLLGTGGARTIPGIDGLSCLPDPPVVEMASIVARFTVTEPGIENAFSGFDRPD
jgi:hypothetical protein